MKQNRRSFITALFAPFVARFFPRPRLFIRSRSLGMTKLIEWKMLNAQLLMSRELARNIYWHGQCPFVKVDLGKPWPWQKS